MIWAALTLVLLGGTVLADKWIYGGIHWLALATGWGLAGANAAGALWLGRRAIGGTARRFVVLGVVANTVRGMVLFGIVVGIWFFKILFFSTFILALIVGYFLFLTAACIYLFRQQGSSGTCLR